MTEVLHRVPFSDATNVPRPSRRPCASVPSRHHITHTEETHKSNSSRQRGGSPLMERSLSPLSDQVPLPPLGRLSIPQMYDRMNSLMLEMNVLMVQWENALRGQPTLLGEYNPPTEHFKGMLGAFGEISAQFAEYQRGNAQTQVQSERAGLSQITTVQQSAGTSRSNTISPDAQCETLSPTSRRSPVSTTHTFSGPVPELEKDCIVAVVEFKRQRMKRFACAHFIEPGQYVIVDGDRGQDCGFVVYCSVRNPDGSHALTKTIENTRLDVSRIKAERGIVRGLASDEDIALLHGELATHERMALKICRELVEQMDLPMKVVDCEYQFDRKKISFYFESNRSIDFRTLTTELYRIFGVRIWLENQNNKVKNVVPEGAFSQSDKIIPFRNSSQSISSTL